MLQIDLVENYDFRVGCLLLLDNWISTLISALTKHVRFSGIHRVQVCVSLDKAYLASFLMKVIVF